MNDNILDSSFTVEWTSRRQIYYFARFLIVSFLDFLFLSLSLTLSIHWDCFSKGFRTLLEATRTPVVNSLLLSLSYLPLSFFFLSFSFFLSCSFPFLLRIIIILLSLSWLASLLRDLFVYSPGWVSEELGTRRQSLPLSLLGRKEEKGRKRRDGKRESTEVYTHPLSILSRI